MICKLSSIGYLLITISVITHAVNLKPPHDFTWPLEASDTCFAATFNLKLNLQYKNKQQGSSTVTYSLDETTYQSYSVTCDEPANIHQLTISMLNPYTVLVFKFQLNDTNVTSLSEVYGYLYLDESTLNPAPIGTGLYNFTSSQELFVSPRDNSYKCITKTKIENVLTNDNVTITSIDLENLQVQPFYDATRRFDGYNDATFCKADLEKNSNLIPIVVGACLAVLIVVVLLAYLIGRRRSRPGYQTV